MKRQLIALSMVILMVASVCAVAATTVSALTTTSFSIGPSTTLTPAVGDQFTITGKLTTTSSGTPLTYKAVHLESHKKNSDGTWTAWGDLADTAALKTGSDGTVSSTRTLTTSGVREYRWHFPATSTYAAAYSLAKTVTAKVATTLTMSAFKTTLDVGEQYTLSGDLKDKSGNALAGRTIHLIFNKGSGWIEWVPSTGYVKTDASGHYSWSTKETSPMTIIWETKFAETSQYWGAASANRQATVKYGTTLTLSTPAYLDVGEQYTLSGDLKDKSGNALAGRTIHLIFNKGSGWIEWVPSTGYVKTDASGHYSWSTKETSPMTIIWETKFAETSQYWGAASANKQVTVKYRGTLTIKSTASSARAGQTFTIYGYLKDKSGNALAGQTIDVYASTNANDGRKIGQAMTDSSGKYSLVTSWPDTTSGGLKVSFSSYWKGNSAYYAAGNNPVTVTIY